MSQGLPPLEPAPFLERWALALVRVQAPRKKAQIFEVRQADGTPAILKVYRDVSLGSEAESPVFLGRLDGNFCVRLLEQAPGALLLEHLGGRKLTDLVKRGEDARATDILIDVAEAIRKAGPSHRPAVDLDQRFKGLQKAKPEWHDVLQTGTFRQAMAIARAAIDGQARAKKGMLHGDLHHTNVLEGQRGWCAIDPLTIYGSPEAEYGQAFCNPGRLARVVNDPGRAIGMADRIAVRTGMDPGALLSWWG